MEQSYVVLDVARSYVAAGLSVIPIKPDGTKEPDGPWKVYQRRRPTDAELVRWFGPDAPVHGIGIVGGAVSGNLVVLDFESEAAFDRWCQTVGAFGREAVNGDPLAATPSGGRHLYLRTPAPVGNMKLAKDRAGKTTIETRGEGGQVLAPGCPGPCHPTGREYVWLRKGWLA